MQTRRKMGIGWFLLFYDPRKINYFNCWPR